MYNNRHIIVFFNMTHYTYKIIGTNTIYHKLTLMWTVWDLDFKWHTAQKSAHTRLLPNCSRTAYGAATLLPMLSECHTSPISQLMILFLTLFLKEMAFSLYNPCGCFLCWLGVVCLWSFYSKHQVEFSQPMIIFSHTNLFTSITRLGIPLGSIKSPWQRLIKYC